MVPVITVRATRKLLQRLGPPVATPEASTNRLGAWYATVLSWRPQQVALFVSELTLLPVVLPLAPAATVLDRFPDELADVLVALRVPLSVVGAEVDASRSAQLATPASRSVVGSMNEFAFLADHHRTPGVAPNLLDLSVALARTPCGPLFKRHVSPDREVMALLGTI